MGIKEYIFNSRKDDIEVSAAVLKKTETPKVSKIDETSNKTEMDLKKFFFKGQWKSGGSETVCGGGSTTEATANFRKELPKFLKKNEISFLLDAPCGDFAWMRLVDLEDIHYIGMDIVDDFTRENREKYGGKRRRFITGDITKDIMPPADLLIVRDCLFHLPYEHCIRFFRNFLRCDIPNVLLTTHPSAKNKDIDRPGKFRQLNLCAEPFNLPNPLEKITDHLPGQAERVLAHWTAAQIKNASSTW